MLESNLVRTSNPQCFTSYTGKWEANILTSSLYLHLAYSIYLPFYDFLITKKTLSSNSVFISIINLQSVLWSSFLIGELIFSTSNILKSTILLRIYLYFTTTFLSYSFYFISKSNFIYSMSFRSIPYLSTEIFEAKIYQEPF